ncbi:hypothetical protein PR003_g9933 [Phytophthora rubi]|uniref:Uncharacterized protein n=2 Tax=Phytophthora TaxID=4783 RepID=A0A6A4FF33_9STRA|nr:hypothetical protein PR001_g9482 [Phytophthora rubi]KAE9341546.1 hypothetical protein PR003_g9933 [Phytophthora rubi]
MQHVRRGHPDYEAMMLAAPTAETGLIMNYVRRSAQIVYDWLDRNLKNNLPLHFCEKQAARRYPNLDPICVETLLRALNGLTRIAEPLGCQHNLGSSSTAGATRSSTSSPSWPATRHYEFPAEMLPRDYGKQVTHCLFLVSDSCAVNRLLATRMGVSLVGCVNHLLNRPVQADVKQHEEDLATFQSLMVRLRMLKQSAQLRLKTPLRQVIRQYTRWSSTFSMMYRYCLLLEHLDTTDDALVDVLPAPASNKRLLALLKDLMKIKSVSKAIQETT